MATLWVSTSGNNANSGLTYALAKADIWGAIGAASKGDTINIVNDGNHLAGTSTDANNDQIDGTFAGTDYTTDPGLTVQGVDSSGNPALATIAGTASADRWVRLDDCNYITFRGLRFDMSARAAETGGPEPFLIWYTLGSVRFFDCEFLYVDNIGTAVSITNTSIFEAINWRFSSYDNVEVARCVLWHCRMGMPNLTATGFWNFHHNIFINDADEGAINSVVAIPSGSGGTYRRLAYNTFVMKRYGSDAAYACVSSAGDDTAQLRVHSNLYYVDCGTSVSMATPGIVQSILNGGSSAAQTNAQTMGNDVFALGPEIMDRKSNWGTLGYASYQFDPLYRGGAATDPSVLPANSEEVTNISLAGVFNSTSTWTWTPDDYSHELPYDMRPIVGRTSALDGGPVGAVDDLINNPPVISGGIPGGLFGFPVVEGETLTVTAGDGPASVSSDPDDDTLTYGVVSNVTHGMLTFNTTTGAFTYEAEIGYTGSDSFTFEACDGTTCTSLIVDSVFPALASISISPIPEPPPEEDDAPNYSLALDSLPFYRPVLEADAQVRVMVQRNLQRRHIDFSHYLRDERWNEMAQRYVQVGASSSTVLSLAGVNEAKALMLQTDQDLTTTVVWNTDSGTDSMEVTVSGCLMFDQVPVHGLSVSNTSSVTAHVHLSVFE